MKVVYVVFVDIYYESCHIISIHSNIKDARVALNKELKNWTCEFIKNTENVYSNDGMRVSIDEWDVE